MCVLCPGLSCLPSALATSSHALGALGAAVVDCCGYLVMESIGSRVGQLVGCLDAGFVTSATATLSSSLS